MKLKVLFLGILLINATRLVAEMTLLTVSNQTGATIKTSVSGTLFPRSLPATNFLISGTIIENMKSVLFSKYVNAGDVLFSSCTYQQQPNGSYGAARVIKINARTSSTLTIRPGDGNPSN